MQDCDGSSDMIFVCTQQLICPARDRYQLLNEQEYSGHVYLRVSPYGHTLKGKKPNKDEIQIRLGLGALMDLDRKAH